MLATHVNTICAEVENWQCLSKSASGLNHRLSASAVGGCPFCKSKPPNQRSSISEVGRAIEDVVMVEKKALGSRLEVLNEA
jgi:hypothetical protein